MSEAVRKAAAALQAFVFRGEGRSELTLGGDVTAVDEDTATCSVQLVDGTEITEVQLKALKSNGTGLLLVPKVGSFVALLHIGGPDYIVLDVQEIDKVICYTNQEVLIVCGASQLTITPDGFKMERSGESLTKLLTDLLTAIEQLTVTTSTGPSGVPINVAAFQAIGNRIPNLLK